MRFMADIAPQRFGPIAEAMCVSYDAGRARHAALECADGVAEFVAQLDVPHSLSEANVPHKEITEIASFVLDEVERAKVIDRAVTWREIVSLLESAYA
jgi:alcohol dehydrogenase class IV